MHESVSGGSGRRQSVAEKRVEPDVHRVAVVRRWCLLVSECRTSFPPQSQAARFGADPFDVAGGEPLVTFEQGELEGRRSTVHAQDDHVHVQLRISGRSSMCSST